MPGSSSRSANRNASAGLAAGSAEQSAQAGEELRQGEGLRQVVVRARVEARDPAVDLGLRSEHEHGNRVPGRAEMAAHLEPVDARHEDVEDDRIGLVRPPESRDGLVSVGRELDLVALELESAPERLADRRLVVDDEDAHGFALRMSGIVRDVNHLSAGS